MECETTFQVGDRVEHADEDVGLFGTVVEVSSNGWLAVEWDRWFSHSDQVRPSTTS